MKMQWICCFLWPRQQSRRESDAHHMDMNIMYITDLEAVVLQGQYGPVTPIRQTVLNNPATAFSGTSWANKRLGLIRTFVYLAYPSAGLGSIQPGRRPPSWGQRKMMMEETEEEEYK